MEDIILIRHFLSQCGVGIRDVNLVAEMLFTIEKLAGIQEKDLRELSWVTKSGEVRTLLKDRKIRRILTELQATLFAVENSNRVNALRSSLLQSVQKEELVEFMSAVLPTDFATFVAVKIGSLGELLELHKTGRLSAFFPAKSVHYQNLVKILEQVKGGQDPVTALKSVQEDRVGFSSIIVNGLFANQFIREYKDFDSREFLIGLDPLATLGTWDEYNGSIENALRGSIKGFSVFDKILNLLQRAHSIFTYGLQLEERRVVYIFSDASRKVLTESVPSYLKEAIKSTHPFLLRPLFRSYPSALGYAVGGKVASSLETIWGSVGEELYLAMNPGLRAVRNGGIDVIDGRNAYDIKSGPAIMNNDQVAILHTKQRVIQDEKEVPSLDTFRVALVYGKEEDAFGTMIHDVRAGNILPARVAWEKLTRDPLAPERVYALGGLVADIVGVEDIIESATIAASTTTASNPDHALESDPSIYDKEFQEIFENSFDPPKSQPKASLDRLKTINKLRSYVRDLLL